MGRASRGVEVCVPAPLGCGPIHARVNTEHRPPLREQSGARPAAKTRQPSSSALYSMPSNDCNAAGSATRCRRHQSPATEAFSHERPPPRPEATRAGRVARATRERLEFACRWPRRTRAPAATLCHCALPALGLRSHSAGAVVQGRRVHLTGGSNNVHALVRNNVHVRSAPLSQVNSEHTSGAGRALEEW